MSVIHYKLITNKSYEKITFDGVALSVLELKKQIMEKKFRMSTFKATMSSNGQPASASVHSNRRQPDVDLEVTNMDTNESMQHIHANTNLNVLFIRFQYIYLCFRLPSALT